MVSETICRRAAAPADEFEKMAIIVEALDADAFVALVSTLAPPRL
jgi:hypothetical protein